MVTFLCWFLGMTLVAIAGATAFFALSHPPVRLMPPSLLFQDTGPDIVERSAALGDGSRIEVFYATSRLPVGPRDNRVYTVAPDYRMHLGQAELRIGEGGSTLDQMLEWSF